MKKGKIIPNGVKLSSHEYKTVLYFTNLGKNIELIPTSRVPYTKTPDFKMDRVCWEMKCPNGKGKYLIRDTIINAMQQSEYIVIDLRRSKLHQTKSLNDIKKFFYAYKNIKRILIITKSAELIDFKK